MVQVNNKADSMRLMKNVTMLRINRPKCEEEKQYTVTAETYLDVVEHIQKYMTKLAVQGVTGSYSD